MERIRLKISFEKIYCVGDEFNLTNVASLCIEGHDKPGVKIVCKLVVTLASAV